MRRKTQTYEQHKAAERAMRKRHADKLSRAPSMPQITMALGYAVREIMRQHGGMAHCTGDLHDVANLTLDRLRESRFLMSNVTVSRLHAATAPDAHITSSVRTAGVRS